MRLVRSTYVMNVVGCLCNERSSKETKKCSHFEDVCSIDIGLEKLVGLLLGRPCIEESSYLSYGLGKIRNRLSNIDLLNFDSMGN